MLLPTLCGLAHPGDVGLVSLRFVPGRGFTHTGGRPLACAAVPSKFGPNDRRENKLDLPSLQQHFVLA